MKILVPVKQVASLEQDFALQADGSVSPHELSRRLNEWDDFSLEAALALNQGEGGEVVVVTVGDEQAEQALLAYLAKGADRAIRVWDETLESADALTVARVLAAVARAEAPELILCGAQSSDAAESATGIALAGLLELAHVAVVAGIEREGGSLSVQRELEGGAVELLRIDTPCLLTVQSGIDQPRHATLRAIKQARAKPLSVRSLAELGLDADTLAASAGSRTLRLRERAQDAGATLLEGEPAEIATRIAEIVREAMSA